MIESYLNHVPHIDPLAFVHKSAVLIGNVSIGANSSVWPNTTIRADDGSITVGQNTSIQDGSVLHLTENLSNTSVGDCCTVGHMVLLHGCIVGNHSLIGMGSILLDNAQIGDHCLVGAGSLVLKDSQFPPESLILGRPAKVIRTLTQEELDGLESSWQHYVLRCQTYREATR